MSTRGSVAWMTGDGKWKGVYNHMDSYLSELGKDVFEEARKVSVGKMIEDLMQVGDWREYVSKGVCEYCGKKKGQPHSISIAASSNVFCGMTREEFIVMRRKQWGHKSDGEDMLNREMETADYVLESIEKTGYPDPKAKFHKHGQGKKNQFDPRKDALFIEWIYLLDKASAKIEVWTHVRASDKNPKLSCTGMIDDSGYTHVKVLTMNVSKDSAEPVKDWISEEKRLEDLAEKEER